MQDTELSCQLSDHYQRVRGWHVRMAVATIHFGVQASGTELEGAPASGTFRAIGAFGRRRDFWSPRGIVVAAWQGADHAEVGDWGDQAPAAVQELVPGGEFFTGPRPCALRWIAAEGTFADSQGELDLGGLDRDDLPEARWSYRSPGGTEALSIQQEMLVSDLASFSFGDPMHVRPAWADVLLAPPYSGATEPPRPENVASAARRLAQVGVEWSTWAEDLARPRPSPSPLDPEAALFLAVRHSSLEGCARALADGAKLDAPAVKSWAPRVGPVVAGVTCLHQAIRQKDRDLTEWLLAQGARIDLPRKGQLSHWGVAVHSGTREICEILLRHGADPHAEPDGKQLFGLDKSRGDLDVVRLLLEIGAALPPEKPFPGLLSTRAMLALMAREAGDESLALRLESYQLTT